MSTDVSIVRLLLPFAHRAYSMRRAATEHAGASSKGTTGFLLPDANLFVAEANLCKPSHVQRNHFRAPDQVDPASFMSEQRASGSPSWYPEKVHHEQVSTSVVSNDVYAAFRNVQIRLVALGGYAEVFQLTFEPCPIPGEMLERLRWEVAGHLRRFLSAGSAKRVSLYQKISESINATQGKSVDYLQDLVMLQVSSIDALEATKRLDDFISWSGETASFIENFPFLLNCLGQVINAKKDGTNRSQSVLSS